jgi:hypothetical protein
VGKETGKILNNKKKGTSSPETEGSLKWNEIPTQVSSKTIFRKIQDRNICEQSMTLGL